MLRPSDGGSGACVNQSLYSAVMFFARASPSAEEVHRKQTVVSQFGLLKSGHQWRFVLCSSDAHAILDRLQTFLSLRSHIHHFDLDSYSSWHSVMGILCSFHILVEKLVNE